MQRADTTTVEELLAALEQYQRLVRARGGHLPMRRESLESLLTEEELAELREPQPAPKQEHKH